MPPRILLFALLVCFPGTAAAQTLFEWPASTLDVGAYATIEECAAASYRVRFHSEERKLQASGVLRDTMPFDPQEYLEPYDPVVRETTRKCLARFTNPDSVSLDDFHLLLPLYLHAEWDDKARVLWRRRFAALDPDTEKERLIQAELVLKVLVPDGPAVRPPRFALAEEFVVEQARNVKNRGKRLELLQRPMSFSRRGGFQDTVMIQRVVARARALADSLTPTEWEAFAEGTRTSLETSDTVESRFSERLSALLHAWVGDRAVMDSLRRGTAAYVALQESTFRSIFGQDPELHPAYPPIGKRAPQIEAEFWLGDSGRRAPQQGRLSLVLLLENAQCASPRGYSASCASGLHTLKRLMERFPALDATVVARTLGYFMYLKEGMTDSTEAALTRRMLDSRGVTARLAMKVTPYWRLPAPDQRRIDRADPNQRNYSFGKRRYSAYLVDEDGVIVYASHFNRYSERDFAERIEALLQRSAR